MKRISITAFILSILITVSAVTVFADVKWAFDITVGVGADATNEIIVTPNQEFTAVISCTQNSGLIASKIVVNFNSSLFSKIDQNTTGNVFPNGTLSSKYDPESATFNCTSDAEDNYTGTGKIAEFTFKAANDITPGVYEFKLISEKGTDPNNSNAECYKNISYIEGNNYSKKVLLDEITFGTLTVTVLPAITDVSITTFPSEPVNGYVEYVDLTIDTNIPNNSELLDTIVYRFGGDDAEWQTSATKRFEEDFEVSNFSIAFNTDEENDIDGIVPDNGYIEGVGYISYTEEFSIDYIDSTPPVIISTSVTPDGAATEKTITVVASDSEVGLYTDSHYNVEAYQYLFLADDAAAEAAIDNYLNPPPPAPQNAGPVDPNTLLDVLDADRWTYDIEYTFNANTSNGKVYVFVRDRFENISYASSGVDSIDTVVPTIDSIEKTRDDGVGLTELSEAGVKVTVTADDQTNATDDYESGIATTNGYSFDGGITWQSSNIYTYTDNGIFYIKVKDNAGNVSEAFDINIGYIKTDDTPYFEIATVESDLGVNNKAVALTVKNPGTFVAGETLVISYDSSLAYCGNNSSIVNDISNYQLTVALDSITFPVTLPFNVPEDSTEEFLEIEFSSDENNRNIITRNGVDYYLVDGGISLKDKTAPIIDIELTSTDVTKGPATLNVTLSDRSGILLGGISFDGGAAYPDVDTFDDYVGEEFCGGEVKTFDAIDEKNIIFTVEYTDNAIIPTGSLKVKDKSVDNSDTDDGHNVAASEIFTICNIDTTAPVIGAEISPEETEYGQTVTLTITAEDKGNGQVAGAAEGVMGVVAGIHDTAGYRFALADSPAAAESILAAWAAENRTDGPQNAAVSPNDLGNGAWQHENFVVFDENTASGKVVCYSVQDNVGNIASGTVAITNVDTLTPVINSLTASTTDPTNQNVMLTANVSEANATETSAASGIASVKVYFEKPDNTGTVTLELTESEGVYSYSTEYNVEYKFTITDKGGNVASDKIAVKNIDKIYPAFDVDNPVTVSTTEPTNGTVTVTVNAVDTQTSGYGTDLSKGIKEYSFDGGSTWQAGNTFTVESNRTFAADSIQVKDYAGNITKYPTEIVIGNIDTTAPVITGDGERDDEETGYFTLTSSEDGELHYIISDVQHSDKSELTVTYTLEAGVEVKLDSTITEDEWYLSYYTVDALGNESEIEYLEIPQYNDAAAPIITDVIVKRTSATSAEITFESNERGTLKYKVTSFALFKSSLKSTLDIVKTSNTNNVNTLTVTGITSSATRLYYYAVDRNGNETSLKSINISKADSTAPQVISANANRTDSTSADFTITVNENSKLYYVVSNTPITDKAQMINELDYATTFTQTVTVDALYTTNVYYYLADEMNNQTEIQKLEIKGWDVFVMQITNFQITRIDRTKVKITFTSNEAGAFKYSVVGLFNSPNKDSTTNTFNIVEGENSITISASRMLIFTRKLGWYAVDAYGNETAFNTNSIPNK